MLISFLHFRRSFFKRIRPRGFTLVELLVVSTIILLMTSYIFFQQSKFNSTTLLRSLTYSMALSVRQAQVYGTSVKGTTVAQASCTAGNYSNGVCFAKGFGVYIPTGTNGTTYYLFADLDGDGSYDSGEELPVFTLGSGYKITALCGILSGQSTCTSLTRLTVFFRRPNPDGCISNNVDGACAAGATPIYSRAYITVTSPSDTDTRSIKVSDTGQITVCTSNLSDVTVC